MFDKGVNCETVCEYMRAPTSLKENQSENDICQVWDKTICT